MQLLKAKGLYDNFVTTHAHLYNKEQAHGSSVFLPWHRKFLLEFEEGEPSQTITY